MILAVPTLTPLTIHQLTPYHVPLLGHKGQLRWKLIMELTWRPLAIQEIHLEDQLKDLTHQMVAVQVVMQEVAGVGVAVHPVEAEGRS